jgi:hypothetical protein
MAETEKRLKKPKNVSRKAKAGCLVVFLAALCFLIWVVYANWQGVHHAELREATEKNLRDALLGCIEYWSEHPKETCQLPASRKERLDWGLTPDKVQLTIVDGRKESFKATAKHFENDTLYQIDGKGNIDVQKLK